MRPRSAFIFFIFISLPPAEARIGQPVSAAFTSSAQVPKGAPMKAAGSPSSCGGVDDGGHDGMGHRRAGLVEVAPNQVVPPRLKAARHDAETAAHTGARVHGKFPNETGRTVKKRYALA